ncbi:MAG: multiheme c-type cytochrome [Methylococcaceae bacterium]
MINRYVPFFLGLMLLNGVTQMAQADAVPYLLAQIQQAKPDAAAIEKAKKQVADLKEITLQKITLVPFHLRKKNPLNDSEVYCTECHLAVPHQKKLRSRAFLNMHTDYVACETCHFRPETVNLSYGWYDYKKGKLIAGSAALFHSGRKKDDTAAVGKDGVSSVDVMQERDGHLKIVPLLDQQAVIAGRSHPVAKALYQEWKAADVTQKGVLKAKLHQPLKTKGPDCKACHTGVLSAPVMAVDAKPALLDFTALGATPIQKIAILQNTIADFFTHYQPEKDVVVEANALALPHPTQNPPKEERIRITQLLK